MTFIGKTAGKDVNRGASNVISRPPIQRTELPLSAVCPKGPHILIPEPSPLCKITSEISSHRVLLSNEWALEGKEIRTGRPFRIEQAETRFEADVISER